MTLDRSPESGERDRSPLVVVPTERHVERAGLEGARAETRGVLLARLLRELAPEARWAPPEVTRLALTESLRAALWDDELLGPLVRGGGGPYLRTVELVDAAIGQLRRAGTSPAVLEQAATVGGGAGLRAATLRRALVALDRTLEARALIDARAQARVLEGVLRRTTPDQVIAATGAREIVARAIVTWDAADLAWWRMLGARLAQAGGSARIELPTFGEQKLDATRERGPLEAVFDEIAPWLEDPPTLVTIPSTLGDLAADVPPTDAVRITITPAADAVRQARAVTHAVRSALAAGAPVDRLAIVVPRIDEEVLTPLRTAFVEAGIPFHEPRGAPPSAAAVVAAALDAHALAGRGLPRLEVAMLLRSRYVDTARLIGEGDPESARRVTSALADALEAAASRTSSDAARTLEETIVAGAGDEGEALRPHARRVAEVLSAVLGAKTRGAHVRAARALWDALGFPSRVGAGARHSLASDEVPNGLARAELGALARDAHGWRVLNDSLDAYAAALAALGLGGSAASCEVFRHELERALEAGAPPPGAGRVGAVRVVRVAEVAGEPLAHLFVLDANEGVLPAGEATGPLLTEALASRLRAIDPEHTPASGGALRARELASLALAASRAQAVTLFYRETGEGGEALAASPLVLGLARAGARTVRASGGLLVDAPLSAREATLQALAAAGPGAAAIDADAADRARLERARETFHGIVAPRPPSALAGDLETDPKLIALLLDEIGGGDRSLPVTALERFAKCAFQGYVHQLLGARDMRVASETPDAREAGTLVHEALAAAMRAAAPLLAVRPVDRDAARTLAMEAADRVLWRGGESALRKLGIELTRERVLRVVEWTLAQDEWIFALAERSFGDPRDDDDAWPVLALEGDQVRLSLRGTIDRVDVSRDKSAAGGPRRVRVIDYKSGADTAQKARRELGATMLQVPLYALAAKEAFGAEAVDGLYLPVAELEPTATDDPGFVKRWDEVVREDAAELRKVVLELVHRVRRGALAPTPARDVFCDQCSFDGVCRRPRFVAAEGEEGEDGGQGGGA